MSLSTWQEDLEKVLNRYYKEKATTACVVAMYSSIRTSYRMIAGKDDAITRAGVLQMLVDLTYGLDYNPFFMAYAARIKPVFYTAVNSYIDSLVYMDEDAGIPDSASSAKIELRHKVISCKNAIHELATFALLCEQGGGNYRSMSRSMRDDLINIEDKLD